MSTIRTVLKREGIYAKGEATMGEFVGGKMNVLFLTLVSFDSIQNKNLYCDLLREFVKNGHKVFVVSPIEKRMGVATHIVEEDNTVILRLRIGNTQKTNIIEKGISTLLIKKQFKSGIKKFFSDIKFDLVLYSTPPITLVGAVSYIKNRDGAKTYLLLKDIFPQNAVDLGMMKEKGIKGLIYRHFRNQEKALYAISDRIGCMSTANVTYVLEHNPEIKEKNTKNISSVGQAIVQVCPNSVEPINKGVSQEKRTELREKYDLPLNKRIVVYGGNLGKVQSIDYLIDCLKSQENRDDLYFLIVGAGVDSYKLKDYISKSKPSNIKLLGFLPKEEFDYMISCCDVGMIITDYRFTIPNFPSRLLAYLASELPVMCVTDNATDIGDVVCENGFGWKTSSDTVDNFKACIDLIMKKNDAELHSMGLKGYDYLEREYSVDNSYKIIMNSGLF